MKRIYMIKDLTNILQKAWKIRSYTVWKKQNSLTFNFFFSGNMRRREDIKRYWFFDCTCPRCSDVTEMGSFMSAVVCFACQKGYLLPIHALEYKSDWICDSCQNVVPYDLVNEVITTIEEQVKIFF